MGQVRLLIVEDSVTFVRGLEVVLGEEKDFIVVGTASSKAEAITLSESTSPHVALVDLRIIAAPEERRADFRFGLETIALLKERAPDLRILAISSVFDKSWLVKAVQAGASGFVSKDALPEELVSALHTVAQGGVALTAEQLAAVAKTPAGPSLTCREREVLRLVAEGKSNREIAQGLGIAVGTVRAHVGSILAKLGATDRKEAVIVVQQQGWT
jgi:DNA-binding NarL/FixJ family response regulator